MNILDLFQAILLLGAPLVALSWFLFTWLFSSGEIDRSADHKTITSRLKKIKKVVADKENQNANYVYEKWSWFGTGFYGLAGLWTFAVIEITQFFSFIFNFPGFEALFGDGIVDFLIEFMINQFGNVIQAFVWFTYWPADSIIIWILIAYLGYWVGVELARRNIEFPLGRWRTRLEQQLEESSPEIKDKISGVVSQVKEKAQSITAELKKSTKPERKQSVAAEPDTVDAKESEQTTDDAEKAKTG